MSYFHVVFTVPTQIGDIAYQNKALVYNLLFKAASETLLTIGADPKLLRRTSWSHRRAPHLGLCYDPSSPCALHRPWRWPLSRW